MDHRINQFYVEVSFSWRFHYNVVLLCKQASKNVMMLMLKLTHLASIPLTRDLGAN